MRLALALFALGCLLSTADAQSREEATQARATATPARLALEQMTQGERKNSSISVEFESPDSEAVILGREVERLWNGGQCDEALAQLGDLESRVGHVAIGNSWRNPVPTLAADSWGTDVRIGNRDSLLSVSLALDTATGNLLAVLRHSGGAPHWSVCMSTDDGATWVETFTWIGSPTTCLEAAMLYWRFFVVYNSPGEDAQQVRLRRFLCTDGTADTFRVGEYWVAACTLDVGDTLKGASLVPFLRCGRLYGTFLTSDGKVLLRWANVFGAPWHVLMGVDSGASGGLDAAGDLDTDTLYFSYCDATDTLRIYRWTWDGLRLRCSVPAGRDMPTSIATYRDSVICAFEDEAATPRQIRYVVNYHDSDTWTMGTLGSADTAADSPEVLAREGKFTVAYRHCASASELRFCQRPYVGPWAEPISIADHEPSRGRQEIVYLGSSVYGVAYLSDTSPVVRGAYFDKSGTPGGIVEQGQPQATSRKPQATIVRGVLFLHEAPSPKPQAPSLLDITGRSVVDLHAGANDVSGLAPGVYFVRSELSAVGRGPSAVSRVVVTR